ncbi:MAG TPA: O-antigen ligase family protein [Anaerolineales bacterium]|nr:O-antigen ligase family protein [Anaerolineales bacterium]
MPVLSISYPLIDVARVSAIVACAGLVWSPTVATVGLVAAYVAFVASGEVFVRFENMLARPVVYWGLAYIGMVLLGTLYGTVPWQERLVGVFKWRTILWFLVLLVLFDDNKWKDRLLTAFIVVTAIGLLASFTAAAGLVQLPRRADYLLRSHSTQAMAFAASALICLWKCLEKKGGGRFSWVWAAVGSLYIANLVFITAGLSGYAVLGIGTAVLLMWQIPPRWWVAPMLGIVLFGAIGFYVSQTMQQRLYRNIDEWAHSEELKSHSSVGDRLVFYRNGLEIAQKHWMLGVGTGGFRNAYAEHVAKKYDPSDWRAELTGDPHNQYLAIWAQQGIVGLAIFLLWLFAIVRDEGSDPWYRQLALALFLGWCITSLFSSHFTTFAEGHLIATFLGVLLAIPLHKSQVKSEVQNHVAKRAMPC